MLLRYVKLQYSSGSEAPTDSRARGALARILCLLALSWLPCSQASALDPRTGLSGYASQEWSTESGLPQNSVHAMLQTSDGFLWLGTEGGLARFDGYGFRVFSRETTPRLPEDDIRCLAEDSSGALWVGTAAGLLQIQHGGVQAFAETDGVPIGAVESVLETKDGRLWVLAGDSLAVAAPAGPAAQQIVFRSVHLPADRGGVAVRSIARDPKGTGVWIGTSHGLYHTVGARLERGPEALTAARIDVLASDGTELLVGSSEGVMRLSTHSLTTLALPQDLPAGGVQSLLATAHGVWAVGRNSMSLLRPGGDLVLRSGIELPGTQIATVLQDRDGTMWVGTNAGLARYRDGHVERAAEEASSSILALTEDRDGDLWIGTETKGATILRDRLFQALPGSPNSLAEPTTSIVQAPGGNLWIGTGGGGVTRLSPSGAKTFTTADGLGSDTILALATGESSAEATAERDDVWVGTPDGLNHLHGGKWQLLTSADGLADDLVRSVLVAADGAVWVGSRHGVTRWKDGAGTILTHAGGLGSDLVGPLLQTADGDLWIGTAAGLARWQGGVVRNFTEADGLPSHTITTLQRRSAGGFWVGTRSGGLALWNGARFRSFASLPALPKTVYAILEDGLGSLWLTSERGIFRVSLADLERFQAKGESAVPVVAYGNADGLPSVETSAPGSPSAWRLEDGRLCFATRRGVMEVRPFRFVQGEPPPPVQIESITVDDRVASAAELQNMTPGPSHFSFEFAGIHLSAPQRVQYRYMLEGVDHDWIDAGTRRTAYYTNIPHGHHIFRVCARNAGGPWSEPAELSLYLMPYAYQTLWFKALVTVLLMVAGFGFYRLRVRVLQSEFQAVGAERTRLAREIHDTLAQSFVAVSVRLEVMSQLLRTPSGLEAGRQQLDQTRSLVRESLAEARRSIWDLRAEGAGPQSLPARLSALVKEASIADAQLETTGTYRPLPQRTEDEVFRIAQESVSNAIRHAEARSLRVRLQYELRRLLLEVADNGRGFEPEQAPSRAEGHFGLTGLQERARLLNAAIAIDGRPGEGTTVRLIVPLPFDTKERKERS